MKSMNMKIFIKQNVKNEEGNAKSAVGMSFFDDALGCVGDYESFDGAAELTYEQITGAVQRLLMKLLPMVPKVEQPDFVAPKEKGIVFKRTEDGKFVPA